MENRKVTSDLTTGRSGFLPPLAVQAGMMVRLLSSASVFWHVCHQRMYLNNSRARAAQMPRAKAAITLAINSVIVIE